jgi:inner membrane protein
MENATTIDRLSQWSRNSVTLKLFTVGFLILLLLIPAQMIKGLVREREGRRAEAVREISSIWAGRQTVSGPVLSVPVRRTVREANGRTYQTTTNAVFLPDALTVDGNVSTESRYRGIYKITVYNSELTLSGSFPATDFGGWGVADGDILWDAASVSLGISDLRGVKEDLSITWNGAPKPLDPGIEGAAVLGSGVEARVPLAQGKPAAFSLRLALKGSEALYFLPLGKTTAVKLHSPWPDPSFKGAFLPESRKISGAGFDAEWKVLHLNRPFPQRWLDTVPSLSEWNFGVELLSPVDQYDLTERSIKYAVLFIFLTFLVFFFIEFLKDKRLHPIQYLLVGAAITIFYLLLLSLSEHMAFWLAYVVASVAVVALIGGYTKGVFDQKRLTALVTATLVLLYGFLYTLLQLEDYALLIGSVGLFATLAVVMYLTRKINWYAR